MARLPRHDAAGWPEAVAVAVGELAPSGDDMTLLVAQKQTDLPKDAILRAESGVHILASLEGFSVADDIDAALSIIGVLPAPLSHQT